MDMDDETLEPLEGKTPEEAEEIIGIAEDHGIDLEQAKEVKELAEELDIDIDEAVEINECL
jgi:type III secretion system FlhB-like substrate exporter